MPNIKVIFCRKWISDTERMRSQKVWQNQENLHLGCILVNIELILIVVSKRIHRVWLDEQTGY